METINLGAGNGISVLELVHTFEAANDMKLSYVIGPRRDGDRLAFWADAVKAKSLLGWDATHTVEDMCRSSWNFEKERGKLNFALSGMSWRGLAYQSGVKHMVKYITLARRTIMLHESQEEIR